MFMGFPPSLCLPGSQRLRNGGFPKSISASMIPTGANFHRIVIFIDRPNYALEGSLINRGPSMLWQDGLMVDLVVCMGVGLVSHAKQVRIPGFARNGVER